MGVFFGPWVLVALAVFVWTDEPRSLFSYTLPCKDEVLGRLGAQEGARSLREDS